jgi:hypothetical protein
LLINKLINDQKIYDIILLEGETVVDKMIFTCKYLNLLDTNKGIFIIEDINSYNEISQIIEKGFQNIKTQIEIFDYTKIINSIGIVLSIKY